MRIFLLETGELFADQINIRLARISLPTTVLEVENCQKRENNFGVKNKVCEQSKSGVAYWVWYSLDGMDPLKIKL
jgi:hypothetical protein